MAPGFWGRYFTGRCFNEYLPGEEGKPTVVLVHGILHRGIMLRDFGCWLNGRGYSVWIYDYQTTRGRIADHGRRLAGFLRNLPGTGEVALVTHSMGGLLTRVALAELEGSAVAGRIKRIVMLAPPHKGSPVAASFSRFGACNWLARPLPDLSDGFGAACHGLPGISERYEFGVIAGDRDEKVPLESTFLAGMKDHVVISSRHSSIMNQLEARKQALYFLEHGKFRK